MPSWLDLLQDKIAPEDMSRARQAEKEGLDPIEFLLEENLIAPKVLLSCLSRRWRIPYIELANYHPDKEVMFKIPEEVARRFSALPLFQLEDRIYVAFSDPHNLPAMDYLRQLTGYTVEPVFALRSDIESAINRYFLSKEKAAQTIVALAEIKDGAKEKTEKEVLKATEVRIEDEEAPIIKLVNYLFSQAVNLGASDIHLEPFPGRLMLRYRIDNVLHEFPPPPPHLYRSLVTRIKIISNLDIAERRMPQDGRASIVIDNRTYDLRISIIPNLHGEGVVIRILDTQGKKKELHELGISEPVLEQYKKMIRRAYGIILATGPTGSGKTTTLYATLKHIYTPQKKFITLEDPVEYQLEGITQIQVHPEYGFTFSVGLRSILRHDPDIMMLGEIRDLESAEIAIRSSLTGHLVLSTLHTNDAPTAITRLIDMGLPPYLVFASLIGVLAQRLIRRLCPDCKVQYTPEPDEIASLGLKMDAGDLKLYRPRGCTSCNNIGYSGRVAISELLQITPEMRQLSLEKITPDKIRELAVKSGLGFTTLRESAIEKLLLGITSVEEVLNFLTTEG